MPLMAKETCVVYGTNPRNDERINPNMWWLEEFERAKKVLELAGNQEVKIICVGGEKFVDDWGEETTEASSMERRIRTLARRKGIPLGNASFAKEEKGLETLEQTQNTAKILKTGNASEKIIHLISSWHQLPRIDLILNFEGITHTEKTVAYRKAPIKKHISDIWNFSAGYVYTLIALMAQKKGHWADGGPAINYYRKRRKP